MSWWTIVLVFVVLRRDFALTLPNDEDTIALLKPPLMTNGSVIYDDYIYLIIDVHFYYKTSCVFFVENGDYEDLRMTTFMYSWTREFSRRGIMTMAIRFPDLERDVENYQRKIVRPLFVVLLTTIDSLRSFIKLTKSMDSEMSFPVWFVIFLPHHQINKLIDYCSKPTDNIFNTLFSTEMLVLCYDNPILHEWYAVSDNRTRTHELAMWRPEIGLRMNSKRGLYTRRSNMFGEVLNIATVQESPFTIVRNGKLSGFFGAIIHELQKVMNFKLNVLDSVDAYGSYNKNTGEWTGVIKQLVNGEADLGVAEFTMTSLRLDAVDFTLPLLLSRNRLYIAERGGAAVQWSGYFEAFDKDVWMALSALMALVPVLLTMMKTGCRLTFDILSENYVTIWGIFCQQGLPDFPKGTPMSIAYFSIFMSSLVILSAYSASLISFLTVTITTLPFNSLRGFVEDGSYKLIVFKNSADYDMFSNAEDKILKGMNMLMKPKKELPTVLVEGFKQVCEKRLAFYTTEVIKTTVSSQVPCKVAHIEAGNADNIALTLSKGSPYTGLINYHLQRFQDNGVLNRLKSNYLVKSIPPTVPYDAVGLWGVAPILAVLSAGMFLAFVILGFELWYKARNKKSNTPKSETKRNGIRSKRKGNKVCLIVRSKSSNNVLRNRFDENPNIKGGEMFFYIE